MADSEYGSGNPNRVVIDIGANTSEFVEAMVKAKIIGIEMAEAIRKGLITVEKGGEVTNGAIKGMITSINALSDKWKVAASDPSRIKIANEVKIISENMMNLQKAGAIAFGSITSEVNKMGTQIAAVSTKSKTQLDSFFASFKQGLFFGGGAGLGLMAGNTILNVIQSYTTGAIKAYADYQQVVERLSFAVKNIAKEGQNSLDKLIKQADYLQTVTQFSRTEILEAQNNLMTQFGLSAKETEKAIVVLADVAAGKGATIESVAQALGAAMEGRTQGLKRLGFDIKYTGDAQQVFNDFLEQGATRAGEAAGKMETLSGQIEYYKNLITESQQETGKWLAGTVSGLETVWHWLHDNNEQLQNFLKLKHLMSQDESNKEAISFPLDLFEATPEGGQRTIASGEKDELNKKRKELADAQAKFQTEVGVKYEELKASGTYFSDEGARQDAQTLVENESQYTKQIQQLKDYIAQHVELVTQMDNILAGKNKGLTEEQEKKLNELIEKQKKKAEELAEKKKELSQKEAEEEEKVKEEGIKRDEELITDASEREYKALEESYKNQNALLKQKLDRDKAMLSLSYTEGVISEQQYQDNLLALNADNNRKQEALVERQIEKIIDLRVKLGKKVIPIDKGAGVTPGQKGLIEKQGGDIIEQFTGYSTKEIEEGISKAGESLAKAAAEKKKAINAFKGVYIPSGEEVNTAQITVNSLKGQIDKAQKDADNIVSKLNEIKTASVGAGQPYANMTARDAAQAKLVTDQENQNEKLLILKNKYNDAQGILDANNVADQRVKNEADAEQNFAFQQQVYNSLIQLRQGFDTKITSQMQNFDQKEQELQLKYDELKINEITEENEKIELLKKQSNDKILLDEEHALNEEMRTYLEHFEEKEHLRKKDLTEEQNHLNESTAIQLEALQKRLQAIKEYKQDEEPTATEVPGGTGAGAFIYTPKDKGGEVPVKDADGNTVLNPDSTPKMQTTDEAYKATQEHFKGPTGKGQVPDEKSEEFQAIYKHMMEERVNIVKEGTKEYEDVIKQSDALIANIEKSGTIEQEKQLEVQLEQLVAYYDKLGVDTTLLTRQISELNKDIIDKQKKAMKEMINDLKDSFFDMSKYIIETLEAISDEVVKANNFRINQTDSVIQTEQALAEKGLKNDLSFEERRRNELEKQNIKQVIIERKLKELQIFLNALESFTKDSSNPGAAIGKALGLLATVRASEGKFEKGGIVREGVGGRISSGIFHGNRHSNGGILIEAEGDEGILSRKEMANLGTSNFHMLKSFLRQPLREKLLPTQTGSVFVNNNSDVVSRLESLERTVKDKKETEIHWDSVGNMIKTEIEKGIRKVTTHKKRI